MRVSRDERGNGRKEKQKSVILFKVSIARKAQPPSGAVERNERVTWIGDGSVLPRASPPLQSVGVFRQNAGVVELHIAMVSQRSCSCSLLPRACMSTFRNEFDASLPSTRFRVFSLPGSSSVTSVSPPLSLRQLTGGMGREKGKLDDSAGDTVNTVVDGDIHPRLLSSRARQLRMA